MPKRKCLVHVLTGDQKGASTDADVHIVLYDKRNVASREYKLDNLLRDDFKSREVSTFPVKVPVDFGEVAMIEVWRDDSNMSADWYVVDIKIEQLHQKKTIVFPVFRWIKAENTSSNNRLKILELDTLLPQNDPNREQREKELERTREIYRLKYTPGMPVLVDGLPKDEEFSTEYLKKIVFIGFEQVVLNSIENIFASKWDSLDDIDEMYDFLRTKPLASYYWKEDVWFGKQRLIGCNPALITLCTEIPEKLGVNDDMMEPILNGETLASLIEKKRLFYTDIAIAEGLAHQKEFEICAPIALFMLNDKNELLPIAIQLNQQKGPENPVFLPTDDYYVWLMAKLWYNNADAYYHQSVLHLGGTHLLMEGVIVAMHRQICVSHPIFKLMAPHTLFLMAINASALKVLVSAGGWVDTTMAIGVKGMDELISRSTSKWRFDLQGTPPAEFKSRNVEDPEVLPKYYYRDDSLLIYDIIRTYVKNYVNLYYDNEQMILDDWEIQNWAEALAKDKSKGGIGLAGVPQRDGKGGFNTIDDLVLVLSSVIYTCSAEHAAVNFLQYDEYAYPPNYPSMIRGKIIKDKNPRTETDIIESVPDRKVSQSLMTVTKLLSDKATMSLGYFETQYIHDPKALQILARFRDNLTEASYQIKQRNDNLEFPYEVLLPENIPNAISI